MNIKKVFVLFILVYLLIGSIFAYFAKPEQLWNCPPFPEDPHKRPTIGNYPRSIDCTKQTTPWGEKVYQETFLTVMWFPLLSGRAINKLSGGID